MNQVKNVVISGSSKGIGKALTEAFLKSGNRVLGISRSDSSVSFKQECEGAEYIHIPCDLADSESIASLAERIRATMPRVDILVNNAGILINKNFQEITTTELDLMYYLHIRAPFVLIQHLMSCFQSGSHIVNISSMGGFQGSVKFPTLSAYSATKGGLSILTEALAVELTEHGISINCLAIGAVQTEMLGTAFPDYRAPLNPEQFAQFAADFCLNGNRYFNGKVLPVSLSTP